MAVKRLMPPAVVNSAPHLTVLRDEVREFVRERIAASDFVPSVDTWGTRWDPAFTRLLAARGWVGMTVPVEYGGHGLTHLERFVVTEELLAAGAPVAAHWIADRQSAPSLLKFGTEQQKRRYLPRIVQGECYFAIGMSEPDSGSDLASVRTKAVSVEGGWSITGTKLWTTGAHAAEAFIVLARSSATDANNRHAGLSQYIVDLGSPGIDIRPVVSMNGAHHFNEVVLEDVFVPSDMVLGSIGDGWRQVTSELAYERSGPERFLSTFPLLSGAVDQMGSGALEADLDIGRLLGRIAAMHNMSESIAVALGDGQPADTAAAVVKLLGTTTEGDIADLVDILVGSDHSSAALRELVDASVLSRPGFTLRGGTTEVLRGVVARELGLR